MNCLSREQLLELLYREGDNNNLNLYKQHILECKDCLRDFLELVEAREYLKEIEKEKENPVVIVLDKKKRSPWLTKAGLIAATLILVTTVIFSGYQMKRLQLAEKRIAYSNKIIEKKIEEVSLKSEKAAKDNYLLLLGLKNYVDSVVYRKNENTRRVNYERF